ncbi:thyroid receptor-interacting protein 11-like [Mytilus californianus]|uniref:thyroid receptor-interacting protein 11-like n=1 Tax=Mytilus californianus TaxID=6549 RepID=UPI0022464641|nr:thyroid receptor-interacting protein 11-like [Mytilus californianus]
MSWIGGSLSSITGQLSNLTKDILTEGTEETSDQGTELLIAKEKIQDCQNIITTLNSENERLKQLNHDLEEKAESSELQINTISQQYRQLLEERQVEIKKLKDDHHELLLHQSTTDYGQQKTEYGEYNMSDGPRDDLDFSDSINMQHEINNLRKENRRLQTQCDQLKALSKSSGNVSTDNKHQKEIEDLQKKLKEVSQQLETENENHQHEVASLQDVHRQKASILRKKFKDEITQYKQKINELEDVSGNGDQQYLVVKESAEWMQLEEKLKSLELDHNKLKRDHEIVCKELKHAKNQLLDQLDSNHQQELKTEINDLEGEQDRVFSEADSMVTDLGKTQQQNSTSAFLDSIEKENLLLKKKNLELQEQLIILEKSVHTLTEEKNIGSNNETEQEQIQQFDAIKADLESEKEALEGVLMELRSQLKERAADVEEVEAKWMKQESDYQVLKQQKDKMEESFNETKMELSNTEFIISSLEMEKENLEKTLNESNLEGGDDSQKLKDELLNKSQLIEELASEKSDLETSLEELDAQHQEAMNQVISLRNDLSGKVENLQTKVKELSDLRDQLIEENKCQKKELYDLTGVKDQLSGQVHSQTEEVEDLNNIKGQLEEQILNQQAQILELKETMEKLMAQIDDKEKEKNDEEESLNKLKISIEEKDQKIKDLSSSLHTLQKENAELIKSLEDKNNELAVEVSSVEGLTREREELTKSLDDKDKLVLSLERKMKEKDENISSIEEKYNFVNEKLQQGSKAETSDFLQRISDLQDTLTQKEELISQLSSESHNFTAEKDKLERMVNKLKEEKEATDKKLTEMREKFNNGAMTINNLHMDAKEMKEKLAKADSDINDKSQKIKQIREDYEACTQTLSDLRNENNLLKQTFDASKDDQEKLKLSEDIVKLKSDLQEKSNELVALIEKSNKLEKIESEFLEYKEEAEKQISELTANVSGKDEEIINFREDIAILKVELEDKVEFLMTENLSLENKVKHLNEAIDGKVQYYETLIKDLKSGGEVSVSITEEIKTLTKLNKEKDSVIKNLTDEIDHLGSISEAETLTTCDSFDFVAKEQTISDLREDISSLSAENELCQSKIQEQMVLIEELKQNDEKLKLDSRNLSSKLDNRSSEHNVATETISRLQNEIELLRGTIQDQKTGITELNDKCQDQLHLLKERESQLTNEEGILVLLRQSVIEKDQQIEFLGKQMIKATLLIPEERRRLLEEDDVPDYSLLALEYPEKKAIEDVEKGTLEQGEKEEVCEEMMRKSASQEETGRDFEESESRNVIEEMEKLQSLIKQKDDVINDLQSNNASLLKMFESKSVSTNDKAVVDIHRLENEIRSLKLEREQIMAVMNEKSREASTLKSEVHRLMNVVAAEKSAIDKLQKDMIQGPDVNEDKDDMHKQALQNLSRLIRDKDLEVESLKQKNETLLTVLQESSSSGTELSTLMQDKDNLARQLKVLQDERDQMVLFVNQKHEESLKYHQEVQRLTLYINTEMEKHSKIQQEYANLAPQFEDKQQALLKAQNELINYRQKYTELEVKYGEMVQKVNTSGTVDVSSYNTQTDELKRTQEKLKELNESLRETEQKVTTLHQQNVEYEEVIVKRDAELHSMRKQVDTLTFQLQGAEGELSDLKQEHSKSEKETSDNISHMQMLKESNNRLMLEVQEREFEIKSLQEKMQTLTSVVHGQKDEEGQLNKLLQENESVMAQVKELQHERHQTIMALKQRQIETQELQRECQKLKEKEVKYAKELERLRGHLLQMEEAYTKDALESEEREKDLRNRLALAEEKVLSSTSAVQSASQLAVHQVESLQQQLHTVASQRDQAYLQLSSLQDQCQQYAVSLSNLQLVLEQFQREKDTQVSGEVEKYQRENEKLKKTVTELSAELKVVKEKLSEAEDGLEAAARLHQQLDKCDQIIAALKEEVQIREATLKNAEVEISDLRNSKDSKVDKLVIKSMFLGYFTAPKNKQDDVLHTIGSVLNFTPQEFEKITGNSSKGGWMSGFLRFGGTPVATPPTTPTRRHTVTAADTPDRSFSELFVKFLETESSPKQTMKLPAEEMALDVQRHHKPVFNPFTAPRHVNHEGRQPHDERHLLMPSSPLSSTLPVFSPAMDTTRPTKPKTSSAILNDVLKSS